MRGFTQLKKSGNTRPIQYLNSGVDTENKTFTKPKKRFVKGDGKIRFGSKTKIPKWLTRFSGIRNVRPGNPATMALQLGAQLTAGEIIRRNEEGMGRAVRRGIYRMMGTTDKAKQITPSDFDMAGPDLTPDIVRRLKPKKKPLPGGDPETETDTQPQVEPTPQREEDPKRKPNQKPNTPGIGVKTPSRTRVGSGKTKTPDKTKSPSGSGLTAAQTAALGGATALTTATALKGGKKVGGGRLPGIGLPGYRGKIGRRSNPQ